jgi:hypothetical protein
MSALHLASDPPPPPPLTAHLRAILINGHKATIHRLRALIARNPNNCANLRAEHARILADIAELEAL